MEDVAAARRELRAAGRVARGRLRGSARADATAAIVDAVLALPEVARARHVLVTAAVGDELDLAPLRGALVARGATVSLPVVEGADLLAVAWHDAIELRPGWQGVLEPVGPPTPVPPDLVVVPALALDRHGRRLGYGGGHFDRYLTGPAAGATTVGAVFHAQLVEEVPVLAHDVVLDVVVTEHGVWRAGHGAAG